MIKLLATIAILVFAVIAVVHVDHSEETKATPPMQCQLFGGHWNIWQGWVCDG